MGLSQIERNACVNSIRYIAKCFECKQYQTETNIARLDYYCKEKEDERADYEDAKIFYNNLADKLEKLLKV